MCTEINKNTFFADNQDFSELRLEDGLKPIGKLEDIDLVDDEVWLLQCPKGMDVKELESQKLKIPGRTNLSDSEAVAVEYVEGAEQQAFVHCRKGKYAVRLVPVRGTIVLRNRLKAAATMTSEYIEECCSPAKRVPMPSMLRARHPLLGHQYEDKIELDDTVRSRLRDADKISAEMLKEYMSTKTLRKKPQSNDADDTDAVVFVKSEEIVKKKKRKRTHSERKPSEESIKQNKDKKICEDQLSNDLQWLRNL